MNKTKDLNDLAGPDKQLLQAILGLCAMPATLERIEQEVAGQNERLSGIEEAQCLQKNSLRGIEGSNQKQSQALEAFYQRQQCMEEASRQQTLLSQQHFDRHVIEPLARQVFPLIDVLSESGSRCQCDQGCEDHSEAFQAELLDLLASYGIEPIHAASGSAFDAKTMQPACFMNTDQLSRDMTVKDIVRLGFRREDRILRPVMVDLYRFEKPQAITHQS